jgi:hypothetical protein
MPKSLNDEMRSRGNAPQCGAMFVRYEGNRRSLNGVFCVKALGHEGEHRGYRKRWSSGDSLIPPSAGPPGVAGAAQAPARSEGEP